MSMDWYGIFAENQNMKITFLSTALLLLVGCAGPTVLQVNTQPAGGYVTEIGSGVVLGSAPTAAQYTPSSLKQSKDGTGCSLIKGFQAQWVSGATARTEEMIRLCGGGDLFNITLSRDPSTPGLDKDLEFALRMSSANAQQRQAAAAEAAAAYQFLGVMQQNAPVTCTTVPIGKTIQTNCR